MTTPPNGSEDLLDRLADLQHDLGKYIAMPLSLLPPSAGGEDVVAALRQGLLATRSGPGGVRSARALWEEFRREAADLLAESHRRRLEDVVGRALAWEARLGGPIDRARAQADLEAVAPAVREVVSSLTRGPM